MQYTIRNSTPTVPPRSAIVDSMRKITAPNAAVTVTPSHPNCQYATPATLTLPLFQGSSRYDITRYQGSPATVPSILRGRGFPGQIYRGTQAKKLPTNGRYVANLPDLEVWSARIPAS